jgi:hypothetical protein
MYLTWFRLSGVGESGLIWDTGLNETSMLFLHEIKKYNWHIGGRSTIWNLGISTVGRFNIFDRYEKFKI